TRLLPPGSWRRTQFRKASRGLAAIRKPPRGEHASPVSFSDIDLRRTETGNARVSIIIPVYGQAEITARCLRSIERLPDLTPFEVIVVDDASPDDTAD